MNYSRGYQRFTALRAASKAGREDVVRALFLGGADPRIGFPMVCASAGGHASIVQMLLEHGADVNAIGTYTSHRHSALQSACKEGHVEIARSLLQYGANVNDDNFVSDTPLSLACEKGHEEIVRILLQNDADINCRDRNNDTPLLHATMNRHTEVARLLIEHGADIHRTCLMANSELHNAADSGDEAIARLLVSKGVDVCVRNKNGNTAYGIARRQWHTNIVNLLKGYGAVT